MGTRSVTHFIGGENDELVYVRLYRQFDGYPTGHGVELGEFLKGFKIVNGYSHEDKQLEKCANGMGCLSAQTICHFKDGIGGFYLVTGTDCWQDYDYYVKVDEDADILVKVVGYNERPELDWSTVEDFLVWCNTPDDED